jgi:hypothetical protein
MSALWSFFWPSMAAGLLTGGIGGLYAFRRKRWLPGIAAALLALAAAAAWQGPLGAADRFSTRAERQAHEALQYYEMPRVTAHLHHGPLTRRLILSKPADLQLTDFQTSELVRLFSQVPGVSHATWSEQDAGLPLILETFLAALGGFLGGLFLAYLLELRRRYNAQWTW